MPTQVSLTNLLMETMVNQLERYLQLIPGIPPEEAEEEAIAGLVRAGKLQDDPLIYGITILVHPSDADSREELFDKTKHHGFMVPISPIEIGGPVPSYFWVKTLQVQFKLFFDGQTDRRIAQERAQIVLSRARHCLHWLNRDFRTIPRDSFGEKAHATIIQNAWLREGGGEPTFIWRGELKQMFLCDVEPPDISGF